MSLLDSRVFSATFILKFGKGQNRAQTQKRMMALRLLSLPANILMACLVFLSSCSTPTVMSFISLEPC